MSALAASIAEQGVRIGAGRVPAEAVAALWPEHAEDLDDKVPAHAELHWANLHGPTLSIMDWEG